MADGELRSLCADLHELAYRSKEKSTSDKYSAAFLRWRKWADKFPEVEPIPAKPLHVAAYLNHLSKTSGFSAVQSAFYSISWFHRLADVPDPTEHNLPRQVKEGIKRKSGKAVNSKSHATPDLVRDIISMSLHSNQLIDLRLAAMTALSYSGFLRFNDVSNLTVRDLDFHEERLILKIRKSKTDVYSQGQSVIIARSGNTTCPVGLLENYLRRTSSATQDPSSFVFRSIHGTGHKAKLRVQNKPITYSRAREVFLAAVKRLGYNEKKFGLHSLRSGGATAAASAGVDHSRLKKHGRWKSDSAKDMYIRPSFEQMEEVSKSTGL